MNVPCIVTLIALAAATSLSAQTWSNPEARCAQAGTVLCNGFEGSNFADWDDYDGNPAPWNTLISDPGPLGAASNHVARLRVPDGRGATDLVKVLTNSSQKLYARWYQQWEPGYDWNALNHGSGINAGSRDYLGRSGIRPTGNDYFSAWIEPYNRGLQLYVYYRGMYMQCSDPNGSCWGDMFPCTAGSSYCTNPAHVPRIAQPQLTTGRWYCIEMMVDGGTPTATAAGANGALNFWIDGTEYGPWENLWMRTSASVVPSILWLNLFHHENHSVEGVLIDNAVVSTTPIGCLGSAAATTPMAPTNLVAQ